MPTKPKPKFVISGPYDAGKTVMLWTPDMGDNGRYRVRWTVRGPRGKPYTDFSDFESMAEAEAYRDHIARAGREPEVIDRATLPEPIV